MLMKPGTITHSPRQIPDLHFTSDRLISGGGSIQVGVIYSRECSGNLSPLILEQIGEILEPISGCDRSRDDTCSLYGISIRLKTRYNGTADL